MTRILKATIECGNCGTVYAGLLKASENPSHPGPEVAPLKCPTCGAEEESGKLLNTESIIGNHEALEGYDKDSNLYPSETKAPQN